MTTFSFPRPELTSLFRRKPRFHPYRGLDARNQSLEIREATERDAPRHLEFMQLVVNETEYMLQGPSDPVPSTSYQRELLSYFQRTKNSLCILACRPGLGPGRELVEGSLTLIGGRSPENEHRAYLSMGVRRDAWGCGIGSRMLSMAVAWARSNANLERLFLEVYTENRAAYHLYRKQGFMEEGVMKREVLVANRWVDLVGMGLTVSRKRS